MDHVSASTRKRAEKIIEDFYNCRGAILVGTQMALPYLTMQGVDLSAVISLDATRSNPTWRADEHVFRLLLELRELSKQEVLIQTRTTPDSVLQNATHGSLEAFYNEEIELREMLQYPPFVTFILLTWTGDRETVSTIEQIIKTITTGFEGSFYSNPTSTDAKVLRHCLFRVAPKSPDMHTLINLLKSLPPFIRMEINPGRIV